jgi:hypothetical protein
VVTTYGEYPIPDNIASLDYYKRLHGHCDLFVCTLGRPRPVRRRRLCEFLKFF